MRISFVWFLLGTFMVSTGAVTAGGRSEPEIPAERTVNRLRTGDFRVLEALEISDQFLDDLAESHRVFPYVLGELLQERGLPEAAERAYTYVFENGPEIWRGRAAGQIAAMHLNRQNFAGAVRWAQDALERSDQDADIFHTLGDALYRSEQYADLDTVAARVLGAELADGDSHSAIEVRQEAHVWLVVSAAELDSGAFRDRMVEAFTSLEASDIHRRLYLYAYYRRPLLEKFTDMEQRILDAVYRVSIGEHSEAVRLFDLVDPVEAAAIEHVSVNGLGDTARTAFLSARAYDPGLIWLQTFADNLKNEPSSSSVEPDTWRNITVAELSAASGQSGEALERYRIALTGGAMSDDLRQVVARRYLSLLEESDLGPTAVVERMSDANLPAGMYSRYVEEQLPALVRQRAWEEIRELHRVLPAVADEARRRVLFVLGLLEQHGHVAVVPGDATFLEQLELQKPEFRSGTYEAAMLAGMFPARGDQSWIVPGQTTGSAAGSAQNRDGVPEDLETMRLLAGARLELGLYDQAYPLWWKLAGETRTAGDALNGARMYREVGRFSQALSLGRRAVEWGGATYRDDDVSLLYPTLFPHEIEAASSANSLDEALVTAVIREESHFNRNAVSPVGARGLMQLMGPTANDMMRRLGRDIDAITEPEANLSLGTEYLEYLKEHMPNRLSVICAYNAGQGRLRSWNSTFGDLPGPLFLEAIPFPETRNYARKVIRSYAVYRYLAAGHNPGPSVAWFFE